MRPHGRDFVQGDLQFRGAAVQIDQVDAVLVGMVHAFPGIGQTRIPDFRPHAKAREIEAESAALIVADRGDRPIQDAGHS